MPNEVKPDFLEPLDQARRDATTAGLKREFCIEVDVPTEEWDRLEVVLHQFSHTYVDWSGYLNKGELAKLAGIASKARKLSLAIDEATQLGLGNILDYELVSTTSRHLSAALDMLANIAPTSPKNYDEKKNVGTRYQDDLKAELQLEIDNWWLRCFGRPADVEKGDLTPFRYFLAQIFKILPPEVANDLGSSRSAVKSRRRSAERRQIRMREISKAFKKLSEARSGTAN